MDIKLQDYLNFLKTFQIHVETIHGVDHGFALDGPIDSQNWFKEDNKPRILFILKEAYGFDGDDVCHIMDNPERFNDSRTNIMISRLSHVFMKASDSVKENDSELTNNILFKILDTIEEELLQIEKSDLKNSFERIAIIEIKKISGEVQSNDYEIRNHSKENKEYLSEQIRLLNPDIIVCGGQVCWDSLTKDMTIFERGEFVSDEKGIYKGKNGLIVYNSYHPSATYFNRYDLAFDITLENHKAQN